VNGYLHAALLHVPFEVALDAAPVWVSRHDLETWHADGAVRPLESYPLPEPAAYTTTTDADKKALILNRIRTFGEHPSGLGKFTRTMFARDLRRKISRVSSHLMVLTSMGLNRLLDLGAEAAMVSTMV
jgi:hypothetical protein